MALTTKKVLIWSAIAAGVIVIMFVGVIAVVVFFGKRWEADAAIKRAEGHEFAKNTTQEGCINEGLVRARSMSLTDQKLNYVNRSFVRACLESSRATPQFCDGVPRTEWAPSKLSDWADERCDESAMDKTTTGCWSVFMEKADFCQQR